MKEYSYFDALAFSWDFHETLKSRYCEDWRHFLWKRYSMKIRILLQERFHPIVHCMKSWWNRFGWAVLHYKNEEKKNHENHENHKIRKAHIFWEDHKSMSKSPILIWRWLVNSNKVRRFCHILVAFSYSQIHTLIGNQKNYKLTNWNM